MKKAVFLFLIALFAFGQNPQHQRQQRQYINLGADPVNPHRKVDFKKGECIAPLLKDTFVTMKSGSGKIIKGWLRKGTAIVTGPVEDTWVQICGYPIISSKPLPLGEKQCAPVIQGPPGPPGPPGAPGSSGGRCCRA